MPLPSAYSTTSYATIDAAITLALLAFTTIVILAIRAADIPSVVLL